MTLVPAYGRDYRSAKEAKASFLAGEDWQIADISSPDDGRYVSHRELKESGKGFVNLRYQKLTRIAVVDL
jgi:hypothetical protein